MDGVMHQSISHGCLVNLTMFGIKNLKSVIRAVLIGPASQFIPQGKDLILKVPLKYLDVWLGALAFSELPPSGE